MPFIKEKHHIIKEFFALQKNWLIAATGKFVPGFIVISFLFLAWRWQYVPAEVPLWYGKPWGNERLAPSLYLLLLPLGSLAWYAVTIMGSIFLTAEYLIFTQLLFLSSFVVSFLSLLTLVKILFLVT